MKSTQQSQAARSLWRKVKAGELPAPRKGHRPSPEHQRRLHTRL